jgi:hypothetical protein
MREPGLGRTIPLGAGTADFREHCLLGCYRRTCSVSPRTIPCRDTAIDAEVRSKGLHVVDLVALHVSLQDRPTVLLSGDFGGCFAETFLVGLAIAELSSMNSQIDCDSPILKRRGLPDINLS